MMHLTQIFR